MDRRPFLETSEATKFVLSKYSHLKKKKKRKLAKEENNKTITVRCCFTIKSYGNQLFSSSTKD